MRRRRCLRRTLSVRILMLQRPYPYMNTPRKMRERFRKKPLSARAKVASLPLITLDLRSRWYRRRRSLRRKKLTRDIVECLQYLIACCPRLSLLRKLRRMAILRERRKRRHSDRKVAKMRKVVRKLLSLRYRHLRNLLRPEKSLLNLLTLRRNLFVSLRVREKLVLYLVTKRNRSILRMPLTNQNRNKLRPTQKETDHPDK